MPALTPLLLTLPLLCGAATTPASPSDPSPLSPSAADPVRRDGAHHHQPAPSYSAPATGYSNPGPSYAAPLPPVHSNSLSYGAPAKGYDAPPSTGYHPAPVKQTGYYYYYYPVDVKKKEKEGKGFYGKMKKMFEPIWYPYNYMMDYFGYGEESYDYDYDSYGHYRSVTETASEYIPWDSIEEVGTVLTQDECMEFYMCQLGSGAYKKAFTGLTGMAVSRNPTHTLGVLYSKNLRALAKMPADFPYRKHTEALINERVSIVKNAATIEEAEVKINCGQIEEVIIQAENELSLSRSMLEWKAWEPLCEVAPENQWKWPI